MSFLLMTLEEKAQAKIDKTGRRISIFPKWGRQSFKRMRGRKRTSWIYEGEKDKRQSINIVYDKYLKEDGF